jgi:hypothetical protein
MDWGKNRGMGKQLETTLSKHYKITAPKSSFPRDMASTVAPARGNGLTTIDFKFGVTQGAKLLTSRKRQHTTSDSIER